jgi:hypothetical protein
LRIYRRKKVGFAAKTKYPLQKRIPKGVNDLNEI